MNLIRLFIALLLDVIGVIAGFLTWMGAVGIPALAFIGGIISFLPDVLGFIFLNPHINSNKKNYKKVKKRFFITFILELLPFGSLPLWTINELFYKENA